MSEIEPSLKETDLAMTPQEFTLIVAATNKMGIGLAGTLPWAGLKKEMAYFARVTKLASPGTQNTVVMGRKTWESIPPRFRPLKDRSNIVITHSTQSNPKDVGKRIVVGSVQDAIAKSAETQGRAFVIGGAQIYEAALKRKETKRILLTRVMSEYDCDTFFPLKLEENGKGQGWVRRSKTALDEWVGEEVAEGVQEENGTRYVFEMWERDE